ncbi:MAG: RtcB family protein [Phycisphaerae bacterium]|nr:RtcB family protein [Phycisphaerae bacterium]
MNARQLAKLGVPEGCVKAAIAGIHAAAKRGPRLRPAELRARIQSIVQAPDDHLADAEFGPFAAALVEERDFVRPEAVDYRTWGSDIDEASHGQMRQACKLPMARAAALMPDAHVGYGLPIGGVLALEGAVVPYAVGVDIACRMKVSVFDIVPEHLKKTAGFDLCCESLEKQTRFGVGSKFQRGKQNDHAVLEDDRWGQVKLLRELKSKARDQLGTSGSGNHFVEFGILSLDEDSADLGLDAGRYLALMSHSGSRGPGASVCRQYSDAARARLPRRYEDLGRLAWLDLNSEAGQEYWLSMNLMGDYASANHDCIHRNVARHLGAKIIAGVENHHNFAWLEEHDGRELVVHRKGATPAGAGVLGVIPGSMASPAFVIRGRGNAASLDSASHGAGRVMSRRAAKDKYNFRAVQKSLAKSGVHVLSAGADEVPGVYKKIEDVMAAQADLVEVVGRFDPKIVKMCGDGSKAED